MRRRTPDEIFAAAGEKVERARLRQASHLNLGERRKSLKRLPSLVGLTYLQSLKIPWTGVSDLGPLRDLPSLESLDISGTPVWDLSPLKDFTTLTSLELDFSSVHDLSPISNLPNLTNLSLMGTRVSDISEVTKLSNLISLDLSNTPVTDISSLRYNSRLRYLTFSGTKIDDLGVIYDLKSLINLRCMGTPVASLAPVAGSSIRLLDIEHTKVSELGPLVSLSQLEWLDIASTEINDLNPLRELRNIHYLRLDRSKVNDLSPLVNLVRLARKRYYGGLSFRGCPISDPQITEIEKSHPFERSSRVVNYLRAQAGLPPVADSEDLPASVGEGPTRPAALKNIVSPFEFGLSPAGTVRLTSSQANWPLFPNAAAPQDHENRLDVCRTLAKDLISEMGSRRYQVREEYKGGLERYVSRLPDKPGNGNILLADAESRTLRNLFAAESEFLSVAFSSKLKTFLEQHIGLRVFYPDIAKFYRDVQTGRIEEALPLDAVDGFIKGVQDNSPTVFDPEVATTIEGVGDETQQLEPSEESFPTQEFSSAPLPPKDPLGEIDSQKASEFTFAGAANNIWRAFLEGEKVNKAIDAWKKTGETLQPHILEIIRWLHQFSSGGGGPPDVPTVGV